jgi:ribosome biogenesis GTPase
LTQAADEQHISGLVVKEQSGFFWVETADGRIYRCRLRGRLKESARSSDIAAIGDRVRIAAHPDGTGSIEEVLPRVSAISRAVRTEGARGAGSPEREHVIVANVDHAFFVFAAAQPAPNWRMIDRFLVVGERANIARISLVINKIDLVDGDYRCPFAIYERLGYPILFTSARTGEGVEALRAELKDQISVFTGPSGVGKTSLLNALSPNLGRAVKAVSRYHQEGVHTTRDSQLVRLESGGYIADTPGIRQLALWDIEPTELDGYFREIAPLVSACRFSSCTHRNEPGCAVREALAQNLIAPSRYESYLSLRDELEAAYAL